MMEEMMSNPELMQQVKDEGWVAQGRKGGHGRGRVNMGMDVTCDSVLLVLLLSLPR